MVPGVPARPNPHQSLRVSWCQEHQALPATTKRKKPGPDGGGLCASTLRNPYKYDKTHSDSHEPWENQGPGPLGGAAQGSASPAALRGTLRRAHVGQTRDRNPAASATWGSAVPMARAGQCTRLPPLLPPRTDRPVPAWRRRSGRGRERRGSVGPIGAQGRGGSQGRKESPDCTLGPQLWDATSHWQRASGPVTGHGPRMQIRTGSRPRHTASFRGTQKARGHLTWGLNYGTLHAANPEPSLATVMQVTGNTRHRKSVRVGLIDPKCGSSPQNKLGGSTFSSRGTLWPATWC